MSPRETLIHIITICVIAILPQTGLIPNFGYSVPIIFLVWLALRSSNENFSDVGFSIQTFRRESILIGSIAAVSILIFMQLVFFPLIEIFIVFEEVEVDLYDFVKANKIQLILMIIMGWLIGGVYEEIVFHGFIFTRLEKMIPGRYATQISFALAAIIFGGYHYQLGAAGLINALIVGSVYLALFLYFKRNLWYSIICHGVYNTIVMIMIYYGHL